MQLTERCDVWRMVGAYDGGKAMQAVYTRVPCLRVPISSFDKVAAALAARNTGQSEGFHVAGRESTDVFLLQLGFDIRTEDELRRGRFVDVSGSVQQYRFTVNGVRDYESFGYQNTIAVFCASTRSSGA